MKDMVTNGTGNSRFLKTSLASGTTWESALAMLREGTFPIDLNGLNNGGITQLGSAYSKANVLPDDVCALLGLNSTTAEPKDAFNVVGNPAELWVWEKKNASTLAHIGYVASPSSTAYPTDGTSGGYRYTRLGQIGEGMTKIETGSYVGTGTYGADNPNSITFGFAPKLFFLYGMKTSTNQYIYELLSSSTSGANLIFDPQSWLSTEYNSNKGPSSDSSYVSSGKKSDDGKTIFWYNKKGISYQYNNQNVTYYYFAIG